MACVLRWRKLFSTEVYRQRREYQIMWSYRTVKTNGSGSCSSRPVARIVLRALPSSEFDVVSFGHGPSNLDHPVLDLFHLGDTNLSGSGVLFNPNLGSIG